MIKRNQVLELKSTVTEMKNSAEGCNSKLSRLREERISKLEYMSIIQSEEQEKKKCEEKCTQP